MSKSGRLLDESVVFSRNIDWNLFKVFREIARHGGVGAAARALNRQQPSISAALKRLEAHVGVALCVRSSRGIVLTAFGRELLATCEGIYASIQHIPRAADLEKRDVRGQVTLRVISNLHLVTELNEVFADFHQRHPHIEIKLDVAPWRLVVDSLKAGDVELGIGFDDGLDSDLLKVPVLHQIQQLYCGPDHPLSGQPPIEPAQLINEHFVLTNDEPRPYGQYRRRYGLGQQVGGLADNLQERMWLIELGMGIGFLPKPIVEASTFANTLWPLLTETSAPVCTIYFMAAANKRRSAPAQLLWDTALRHLGQRESVRPYREAGSAEIAHV
jgi:DNA-binding transcriptional LysR family regulator